MYLIYQYLYIFNLKTSPTIFIKFGMYWGFGSKSSVIQVLFSKSLKYNWHSQLYNNENYCEKINEEFYYTALL